MSERKGWIAVDLDGTLAHYDHWRGIDHIGDPVPKMAERVRKWLANGEEVRIFTARCSGDDRRAAVYHIQIWCFQHFGKSLPVTNEKDFGMVEFWDDRAVQIIPNTGERVDGCA